VALRAIATRRYGENFQAAMSVGTRSTAERVVLEVVYSERVGLPKVDENVGKWHTRGRIDLDHKKKGGGGGWERLLSFRSTM
jgi:hypothetical protein